MSSQAGSTSLASDSPKPAGLDSRRISTNEQGIVLRYFAGTGRFALTWLGPAYNQVAKAVKSSGGKGDASAGSSHKYYADCAGVICVGLVDSISEVWMSNDKVWSGYVARTAGSDSATISVPNKGTLTIYWGTETQPIDPILAPFDHPAYRGQCYIVFNQLYFGQDTTSAPNVEVVVSRSPEGTGLLTAGALNGDVLAPHAMIELLTDQRFGLGWTAADTLDLAPWDAAAAQTLAEGMAISPVLDRDQDARSLMVQFCDYIDGYLTAEPNDGGRLALQLARPFTGDPATLPLLGEYELLDVPNPSSQSWRDTYNEFLIKYTDQQSDYQDNSTLVIDQANRRVVGEPLPTTLDRPWITKAALAIQSGVYAARLQSVPWIEAKDIHIRKEAAAGIDPGSFVRLTYADYLDTIIMRVQSRKVQADRSQEVQFDLRADGYYNEITTYVPDLPPAPDRPVIDPLPPCFQRILELPYGLVPARDDRNKPQLAALVARASGLDVRYRVYTSEDNITYDQEFRSRSFCVYGTLAAAVPVMETLDTSAGGILITFPGPDGGLDLATTGTAGLLRMRLLVFIEDEIIAYRDVQIVSANSARLVGLRRGCYDTLIASHAVGVPVAIIERRDLHIWTDATYEVGSDVFLKVATATAQSTLDLGSVADTEMILVNRTALPLPPLNLCINGNGLAPTFTAGSDVHISWDAASWQRHSFFASWDDAYLDDKLVHKIKLVRPDGTIVRTVKVPAGTYSYTYAASDLAADMGTASPASVTVRLFALRRGMRSQLTLQLAAALTS